MSTSSNHYLCFRRKTQTLCWIPWQWLYRVDLQHLPLCTCEWIFQHDILVESSSEKSHIKWYKCILWNYCIATRNPTPHMLFCLCHVSWKRSVVAKKHHMCFCFSYLARARNFQERLSSLVICLFYSCHLSLTISTFQSITADCTFYSNIIFVFTYCEVLSPLTCFWDCFHWRGPWLLKRAIVWSGQSHFYKHQLAIGEGRLRKCFKLRFTVWLRLKLPLVSYSKYQTPFNNRKSQFTIYCMIYHFISDWVWVSEMIWLSRNCFNSTDADSSKGTDLGRH